MQEDEEGPVYYREIQKNAYLKRIPEEEGSKLRPLSHKKSSVKALWSVLCVHNGRTPYLEQYGERAAAAAHTPVWRASLGRARLVAASVMGHDFVLHAHQGPVRMRAPDWESMQDWVNTLRETLHELRILPKGENVYCAPPAPAAPRAAARDPTSPLPPTPSVPLDRVPGIEIAPASHPDPPVSTQPITQQPPSQLPEQTDVIADTTPVDISDWDTLSQPSTSQDQSPTKKQSQDNKENQAKKQPSQENQPSTSQDQPNKSLAKICGQNICLDDSIFKRTSDVTDSDEEFFNEIDRFSEAVENMYIGEDHRQTVLVGEDNSVESGDRPTNITVIQVSNKEPPHTAIPVFGSEREVFQFDFAQKPENNFVNIVHTESNSQNDYGTVFDKDQEYGHLSLTTTVNLTSPVSVTGPVSLTGAVGVTDKSDSVYERLCLASTSNERASPVGVKNLKNMEKLRKSSLPNLNASESAYEYLYLDGQTQSNNNIIVSNTPSNKSINVSTQNMNTQAVNSITSAHSSPRIPINRCNSQTNTAINSNMSINSNTQHTASNNCINVTTHNINTPSINSSTITHTSSRIPINRSNSHNNTSINTTYINCDNNQSTSDSVHRNAILDCNVSAIRSIVERSHSQNSYDSHRRNLFGQNDSPKREIRTDKQESNHPKPIWRRGLTELSLLTRLRGFGQNKRHGSPSREGIQDSNIPPVKIRASRPSTRIDNARRRSSSLSNEQPPMLQSLRMRQAAALRAEQRRGAALVATVPTRDPPIFADYNKQVWISWWSVGGIRCGGRAGDRLCAVRGTPPRDAAHAKLLLHQPGHTADILFHRVPFGNIYVINKLEHEDLGIKLDGECSIVCVEAGSPARRAGVPPGGRWALTEVNNRPINLLKGGEEDMLRLSRYGTEVSVIIQPTALVKKLRASLKGNKSLLGLR